jgi:predicted 3-demethylubiquinone-9 3-methyltransferase (glyoxalase superfamily)
MTAKPFLMFQGDAEAALNFYVNTIPNSCILSNRYGPGPYLLNFMKLS